MRNFFIISFLIILVFNSGCKFAEKKSGTVESTIINEPFSKHKRPHLPKELGKVKITGEYTTLSSVVAEINRTLKSHTAYSLSMSCPDKTKSLIFNGVTVYRAINSICQFYELTFTIKKKNIILKEKVFVRNKIANVNEFIKFAETNRIIGRNVSFLKKIFKSGCMKESPSVVVAVLAGPSYAKHYESDPQVREGSVQLDNSLLWDVHFEIKKEEITKYYILNGGVSGGK